MGAHHSEGKSLNGLAIHVVNDAIRRDPVLEPVHCMPHCCLHQLSIRGQSHLAWEGMGQFIRGLAPKIHADGIDC